MLLEFASITSKNKTIYHNFAYCDLKHNGKDKFSNFISNLGLAQTTGDHNNKLSTNIIKISAKQVLHLFARTILSYRYLVKPKILPCLTERYNK